MCLVYTKCSSYLLVDTSINLQKCRWSKSVVAQCAAWKCDYRPATHVRHMQHTSCVVCQIIYSVFTCSINVTYFLRRALASQPKGVYMRPILIVIQCVIALVGQSGAVACKTCEIQYTEHNKCHHRPLWDVSVLLILAHRMKCAILPGIRNQKLMDNISGYSSWVEHDSNAPNGALALWIASLVPSPYHPYALNVCVPPLAVVDVFTNKRKYELNRILHKMTE